MKKIFLTVCLGALFSIGAMAQVEEDTTSTDPNLQPTEQADTTTTDQPSENMTDTTAAPIDSVRMSSAATQPIEVLEAKEGPENEIVYKYQGELFYIDRDEQKIVKVEESELSDSPHDIKMSDDDQ